MVKRSKSFIMLFSLAIVLSKKISYTLTCSCTNNFKLIYLSIKKVIIVTDGTN